jgi:hypothetical protein
LALKSEGATRRRPALALLCPRLGFSRFASANNYPKSAPFLRELQA